MKDNQRGFLNIVIVVVIVVLIAGYIAWDNNLFPLKTNSLQTDNTKGSTESVAIYDTNDVGKSKISSDDVSKITTNQATGPFIISIAQGTRTASRAQSIIEGKNGFSVKVGDQIRYGFSARAKAEISGINYQKTINKEGNSPSGSFSFIISDDMPAGSYKLRIFDFTDDTYQTPITSNIVQFEVITVNCSSDKYFNGKTCVYKN